MVESFCQGLNLGAPYTCRCRATVDALGKQVCKQAPSRIARHQHLNDLVTRVLVPCHKGTSRSYTQRQQTPGRHDSDPMAFREFLGLGCDSRQHHSRVLRCCHSSRMRREQVEFKAFKCGERRWVFDLCLGGYSKFLLKHSRRSINKNLCLTTVFEGGSGQWNAEYGKADRGITDNGCFKTGV